MFDHVVMRGNNRQDIFQCKTDFLNFSRVLHYAYSKHPFTIIAYCVMTNHYHLLIRSPEVPLGKVMSLINKRYSNYYRKKYNYSGFLYESRYWAEMVTTPGSLLKVSRYIHRNPLETKIPIVTSLEDYAYSSYPLYHSSKPSPYPFLDLNLLSSYKNTRKEYCAYCETNKQKEENTDKNPSN